MQKTLKIAVVGSGLVGTLLAVYLKKQGHVVHVFDRSKDIRKIDFSGRSINLAMSTRGWKTLDAVGIGDAIREIAIPMDKRAIHAVDAALAYQKYGMNGESIYSISRGELNRMLINLAEESGVAFFFDKKIWDINLSEATLYIGETERGRWDELSYDLVFGADGAFSKIRSRMQRQNRFDYQQHFLKIGYRELKIEAKADASHAIDKNSFHIWPRGDFMLIALPNLDGSFTCTIFMPFEGPISFEALQTPEQLHTFFETYFKDALEIIPNLTRDFFVNPISSLVTTQCFPWTAHGKVALIGDAAHAIVPFYGQGMNAGFEDISQLMELVDVHGDDWPAIFSQYERLRKPNADAIAELSYRNFMEMSTKTADAQFLLRKKIEAWFTALHPEKWLPLYDRVTFSTAPYSEALQIGDRQKEIMDLVMQLPDIDMAWRTAAVEDFILQRL